VTSSGGQPYFEPQIASDADALRRCILIGVSEVSVQRIRSPQQIDPASICISPSRGSSVFVDHVLIVGNTRTKTETIAREVQLRAGSRSRSRTRTTRGAASRGSGIFRRVDISYLLLPVAKRIATW